MLLPPPYGGGHRERVTIQKKLTPYTFIRMLGSQPLQVANRLINVHYPRSVAHHLKQYAYK